MAVDLLARFSAPDRDRFFVLPTIGIYSELVKPLRK